ncbi:MAG: hypothetical protein IKP47_11470 [Ruminococcus sp.]|nr:hypothetical protein [Ruminococcus sp.]
MKKKILSFIRTKWLLAMTVAALIGTMTMIGYAEYDFESNYMKRVVVASSDHGMMFSSNILIEGGSKTYQAKSDSGSAPYNVKVYLWNYSLKNTSQCYPGKIDYSIAFTLTDNRGNPITDTSVLTAPDPENPGQYIYKTIDVKDDQGATVHTFNSSNLTQPFTMGSESIPDGSGDARQKLYTLVFNNWDLKNDKDVCVQVVATPAAAHRDLHTLAAVIGLKETVEEEPNVWQAKISEIEDEINDADGYNLVLSGSGKADIEITWDTSKIDLNKYFRSGNTYNLFAGEIEPAPNGTPVIDANGWQTVTIHADASAYRNRYNIQLYLCAGVRPAAGFFAEASSAGAASAWIKYSITATT